ncbi:FMN-binding protein [Candidatus Saganbacteria bacterium]|nr:FMN-binding protein [Candidatus Saganbacteria bacterium]
MLKKILITVGVILLLIVLGVGLLMYRLAGMAGSIEKESAKLTKVDLKKVADGTYVGSFGNFVVSARVEVTVKNHRIKKITLVDQKCGPGYEARVTIDRMMKAQSPKVDAVTGASSSSRTLMVAVDRALKQGIR